MVALLLFYLATVNRKHVKKFAAIFLLGVSLVCDVHANNRETQEVRLTIIPEALPHLIPLLEHVAEQPAEPVLAQHHDEEPVSSILAKGCALSTLAIAGAFWLGVYMMKSCC